MSFSACVNHGVADLSHLLEQPQQDALAELMINGPLRTDQIPAHRCDKLGFGADDIERLLQCGFATRIVVKGNPEFVAATHLATLIKEKEAVA